MLMLFIGLVGIRIILFMIVGLLKKKEILGQKHEDKVYFDQSGELTMRFGIKHSPAIAVQEGLKIRIDEINLTN